MTSTITARRLLRGNEIVEYPLVTVDDGHITSIESGKNAARRRFRLWLSRSHAGPGLSEYSCARRRRPRRDGRHSAGAACGRSVSGQPRGGRILPHHRHLIHRGNLARPGHDRRRDRGWTLHRERGTARHSSRRAVSFRSQAGRPHSCPTACSHRSRYSIASGKRLAGIFAS